MELNKRINTKYYINSAIGLSFIFLFGNLTPVGPITPVGMEVLGIFIGVLYLWSTVSTVWPGLIALIAFGLSDYTTVAGAIKSGMGHPVVFTLIMITALCGVINKSGSGEVIARWALSRPALKGKPTLFVFVFLLTAWFVSVFISAFVGIYLSWVIYYSIAEFCGYKKGDVFSSMIIVGALFASMLGSALVPFKGWQLSIAMAYAEANGIDTINFGLFMLVATIISFIIITLYVLCMKYIFKADFKKLGNFDVSVLEKDNSEMNKKQKTLLFSLLFIIVVAMTATILPSSSYLFILINKKITIAGLFAIVMCILMILRQEDGTPILDWKTEGALGIAWNPIMLCVVALPIASALTSDRTGVLELMNTTLTPIFQGQTPLFTLLFSVLSLTVLTNLGSNVGMGMAVIPAVSPFIELTGADVQMVGIALVWTANFGLMLPGASALSAVLFANKEWLDSKTTFKYAALCLLLFILVTCSVFTIWDYMI